MSEKIYIAWDDETLAAVKLKGVWRFFIDREIMFLLDYPSYDNTYHPLPGKFRYGTLIVDDQNVELWIQSLSRELDTAQLANIYWKDTNERVRPTFVIDFDRKFWVGSGWSHDQSPLHEYQPKGWNALEDDVMKYLPAEIRTHFE